tara:strand:+ start:1301 stop:1645 length:345 start_codon:yes stop_codon:yes gene_type:complete
MPKKKTKPFAKIDWEQADKMCGIHCTGEEIASILNVDYDTLNAACKREKGMGFSDYSDQKRSSGRASLRRRQYGIAMDGNSTMLIWLGKNWLGQTDKSEVTQTTTEITGIKLID